LIGYPSAKRWVLLDNTKKKSFLKVSVDYVCENSRAIKSFISEDQIAFKSGVVSSRLFDTQEAASQHEWEYGVGLFRMKFQA
jgi:hypothetical protein